MHQTCTAMHQTCTAMHQTCTAMHQPGIGKHQRKARKMHAICLEWIHALGSLQQNAWNRHVICLELIHSSDMHQPCIGNPLDSKMHGISMQKAWNGSMHLPYICHAFASLQQNAWNRHQYAWNGSMHPTCISHASI